MKRHLLTLAALEGLVMASAVLRLAIPGLGIDFADQRQIIWLVLTLFIAASSVAYFVMRTARLGPKVAAGEQVEDERKQILTVSLAILAAAGLLSLAGPQAFARLVG
ncbi:MAG: hypothetical protein Q8N23_26990 [Archangium sp.]|nr:hypothetical protein [Archangium sp.]MDP3156352.1 hypothetical protein [Archangium sp.]MDP3570396.1 hypothetical protein [Archangium sp.]